MKAIAASVLCVLCALALPQFPVAARPISGVGKALAAARPQAHGVLRIAGPKGEALPVVNEGGRLRLRLVHTSGSDLEAEEWSSGSPEVATVSAAGELRGRKYGFSTVRARWRGETAETTVVVMRLSTRPGAEADGDTRADAAGNVYLSSPTEHVIYRSNGAREEVFAGARRKSGFRDGSGRRARFDTPTGLGIDGRADGALYVADAENHSIRRVDFQGRTSVAAGPDPAAGPQPGRMTADVTLLAEARFASPRAVAAVGKNFFVADTGNHAIYYVDVIHGVATLVAGEPGESGKADGRARIARFNVPSGLAISARGDLLAVADTGNNQVRLVELTYGAQGRVSGDVSTLGGGASAGAREAQFRRARALPAEPLTFDGPESVAFDGLGNVLVIDRSDAWVVIRPPGRPPQRLQLAQSGSFVRAVSLAMSGTQAFVLDAGAERRQDRVKSLAVGPPSILQTLPELALSSGGAEVTVLGANFGPETRVTLGDAEVDDLRVVSATELRFVVPRQYSHGARTLSVLTRGGVAQRAFHIRPPRLDEIADGQVTTFAGARVVYRGDGAAALDEAVVVEASQALTGDAAGNIYWAELENGVLRRVDSATGRILTIAGTGRSASLGDGNSSGGDGGLATSTLLEHPRTIAVDSASNVYFTDDTNRIRRVDATSGTISTYAGTGEIGYVGDGGHAAAAMFGSIEGLSFGPDGDLYVLDAGNGAVRRIDAATGRIETVFRPTPEGGAFATLDSFAVDGEGNVFFAWLGAARVWQYNAVTCRVEAYAGNGSTAYSGDGGPASRASLVSIDALAVGPDGSLYITGGGRIRRVDARTRRIGTYAGAGETGRPGNGIPAIKAAISPVSLLVDGAGALYMSEIGPEGGRIRRIDPFTRKIEAYAGSGRAPILGDGGLATSALIDSYAMAVAPNGLLYFCDAGRHTVRVVDPESGRVERFAGTGEPGFSGDGGPAREARFDNPVGLAFDSAGRLYVADRGNGRVRRIDPGSGIVETVAGGGDDPGDTIPARAAALQGVGSMAFDAADNLFLVESLFDDHGDRGGRVRRVNAMTDLISTVAGAGAPGEAGGLETLSAIQIHAGTLFGIAARQGPASLAPVFAVDLATGRVEIAAGAIGQSDGPPGPDGDGGPAREARITPQAIALDHRGDLYIADARLARIRRVDAATGVITTIAGGGLDLADAAPALGSRLYAFSLAIHSSNLFIADGIIRVVKGGAR